VLVANYHAPEETNLDESIRVLHKFGVSNIKIQKEIFDADLYFQLLSIAKFGDLSRMTQFKSADDEDRTGHLLTYPVLMTHDVAGYDEVLVGADQEQHLQFARKLLKKYNKVYEKNLTVPEMNIVVGRVKDLREPDKKMSKSQPQGCVFLDDSPDDIKHKLRKANATELGLENLKYLYKEFVGEEAPESNEKLKETLANKMAERFQCLNG
jgi:tryptophanyl-tRNA synthetase